MAKKRSEIEAAAGKLTSSIQKVLTKQMGDPQARESEEIMHRSQSLIQSAKDGSIIQLLNGCSVEEWLGSRWVNTNRSVLPATARLQNLINKKYAV